MATKQTKTQPAPSKNVSISYKRTADFKSVFSDGSLITVRPEMNSAILTFYEDDVVTTERKGSLKSVDQGVATYDLNEIVQENFHSVHTNIRMSLDQAISLARLIVNQIGVVRPDLIQEELPKKNAVIRPKPTKAAGKRPKAK